MKSNKSNEAWLHRWIKRKSDGAVGQVIGRATTNGWWLVRFADGSEKQLAPRHMDLMDDVKRPE